MYKILEKIMLNREKVWVSNVVDELQGAGQEKCSCLHTSMLFQEAVSWNRVKGATVYVTFIDIRKAFDTVWVNGLLYKLYKTGISNKVWRLIRECYQEYQCAAFVAGQPGDWFCTTRGVHQGAPLSMLLYQMYLNDLLCELKRSEYGVLVNYIDVTCPSFADDCCIIALHKKGLNHLLDIAYRHSAKWRYEFNMEKTVVMVWGNDDCPDIPVTLGDNVLKIVPSHKHLGVDLASKNNVLNEIYNRKIGEAQKIFYTARGLGSHYNPVPTNVLSKLYWSVVIPKMTYGLEVRAISDTRVMEFENVHRKLAKAAQHLPINTPSPAPLATLGWTSLESYLDMKKILFLWKIFQFPVSNIYRRIVTKMLQNNLIMGSLWNSELRDSPVNDMFKAVCKHGMENLIRKYVIRGELDKLGTNMNKNMVKQIIWEHESNRWKATCLMYPELRVYNDNIKKIEMHPWWKFCRANPGMTRRAGYCLAVFMGVQPLGMQRNLEAANKMCSLCKRCATENANHVLFECTSLITCRTAEWSKVLSSMPYAMAQWTLENEQQTENIIGMLLSGLGGSYVSEWNPIYKAILNFVWNLYDNRQRMYDILLEGPGW